MKETLNLLPAGIRKPEGERGLFYYLSAGIAVYMLVMTLLWLFKITEVRKLDSEIKRLTQQKAELQQRILPPPPPEILSGEKEIIEAIKTAPQWSLVMSDLSVLVPEDVWLSSIESRQDRGIRHMNIKGFSTSQLGVAGLVSALEASHYFYEVEIVFAQKGEKDISFELKAKVKWT